MTLNTQIPQWEGTPLLPEQVEGYWGQASPDHLALAEAVAYQGTPKALGKPINNGSNAIIYDALHDSSQVVKVTNEYDEGFSRWMEGFVLKNQDNPHVPQVKFYFRLNDGTTVAVMERLTAFDDAEDTSYTNIQKEQFETIAEELSEGTCDAILSMDISEELLELLEFLMDFDANWQDCAAPNAMFRGDTLVITDPMV